jgi:hypothetical protein
VLNRLRGRGLGLRRDEWAESKVDECLTALRDDRFATQVWTDTLPVKEVADHIADTVGLHLTPNTDNRLVGHARRTWTSLKHIRLG